MYGYGGIPGFGGSYGLNMSCGTPSWYNNNFDFGGGEIKDPNNGLLVPDSASETISSLAWAPNANNLVAGAWDGSVRCWQVANNGQCKPLGMQQHSKPVLDICWQLDGAGIFSASADGMVKMWDCSTSKETVVAKHDFAIKSVRASNHCNKMLVTGGWDHKVRYWDHKNPTGNHLAEVDVYDKVYCMDLLDPMLIVGTGSNYVFVFDVRKGNQVMRKLVSQLRLQLRACACFPDKGGFLLASIDGRVSVRWLDGRNYSFKCHRRLDKVFPVNCLDFHPVHKTFLTAGSDGTFAYWEKDERKNLRKFDPLNAPITAARFSMDGTMMAYAAGYDWYKGHKHQHVGQSSKLFLRPALDARV